MTGVKRTALRPGRADHGGHRARARRLAGLRQGRRPQRHGHRHRRRLPRRRPADPLGAHRPRARSPRRSCGPRRPRRSPPAPSTGRPRPSMARAAARFGALAAAASRPDRRPPGHRGLPPAGRRGPRPPPAAPGVPGTVAGVRIQRAIWASDRPALPGRIPPRDRSVQTRRTRRWCTNERGLPVARQRPSHDVADAWLGESLLFVLRERLGLLGAKGACEQGECGSCSVLVDGELVCSCLVLAASAVDQPIVTVEGLAEPGAPTDVQRAFVEAGAVQCGFCTPGLVMAAHALLDRRPAPDGDRDPRGAVRQHLPLHRLRPDHRRRAGRRRRTGGRRDDDVPPTSSPGARPASAGSATRRPAPTGSPRPRARSPSRRTCRSTAPRGAPRCARRTRTPASSPSTPSPAWAIPGVAAVITADDVPGKATYGLIAADQPVFAARRTCATSASRSPPSPPTTPRRAAGRSLAIDVDLRGARPAARPRGGDRRRRTRRSTPTATCCATSASCAATWTPPATSSSRAPTRSACRTRRSSAWRRRWPCPTTTAAASSCTSPRSGCTRTASRSPPASPCRRTPCASSLGGVGGAFGAREDISLQVHTCLLALRLGRPVRMAYSRAESFLGHVHRHPATIWMRHHATADGEIVKIEARFVLDGGRLRLDVVGGAAQRHHPHPGPVPLPQRRRRGLGRAHQPPAVRGDARLRRRPGVLRPRGPDGPARRGVRARPRRAPAAQRHGHRRPADHRAGRRERGARWPAASGRRRRCRCRTRRSASPPTSPASSTRCACRAAPG